MKITTRWGPLTLVIGLGVLNACSGPMTDRDFLARMDRVGIPHPDRHVLGGAGILTIDDAELPPGGLTLRDLVQRADRVNPQIQSARAGVGIAAGHGWQAGLYPNPTVSVSSSEIGFERGSSNTLVGVAQPIVMGGRLRAAIAAADAEEAAKLADLGRVRRGVLARVAELHARIVGFSAQLELIDELLQIGERTLEIAETRFEARAVAEPDVIRPRIEVFRLRADRDRIARELGAAEIQLGLALETDPIRSIRLAAILTVNPDPIDVDGLHARIETGHPALLVADREIEAAEANLRRIRAERVPDVTVSAGVGYSEEGDQGIAEIGVGAQIPLWDSRQGDLMSARYTLMKRRQDRAAARIRLLTELAEAVGHYEAALVELRVVRESMVPEARRAFEQIDEAYRAGRASFMDLLDAQRTLMQVRRTLIEIAGRAESLKARIASICGIGVLLPSIEPEPEQSSENPESPVQGQEKQP